MIQANELRIGNLFQDVDGTFCYYAGSWQRQDGWIHRDSANNTYKDKEMYPLPLNPEILLACGFMQSHPTSRVNKLVINYEDSDYPCTLQTTADGVQVCRSGIGATTAPVKYLHQLQNLYFALTGKELAVNIAKTIPA